MARWHFRMLNDSQRNLAFKRAVQYWIRKGKLEDVMDIGSGTGLLSLYAATVANVKSIYAIECSEIMARISASVFQEHPRGAVIKLVSKHSMDLKIPDDIPSRVSLVVSETLDAAAFGEGILETLIHAKEHLMLPEGKIVPHKVQLHIAGYKSKYLAASQILLNDTFRESFYLDNFRLVGHRDEPYDADYVDRINDFVLVTDTADGLEVNFNDLQNMKDHYDGKITMDIQLQSQVMSDYLDGFIVWFTLQLNEMDPENLVRSEPNSMSCWNQAIFKLNNRILLRKWQVLNMAVSATNGVLKIDHTLDQNVNTVDVNVQPLTLQFINDSEYLNELEIAINEYFGDNLIKNCIDFQPFPYIGLVLLKEKRLNHLWCTRNEEEFVRLVVEKNCISMAQVTFVDSCEEFGPDGDENFDLILVSPFDPLGGLANSVICEIPNYRAQLSSRGILVPHKIQLFGELINCDWLVDSCQVTNVDVKRLKIDKFINTFATELHLDLDNTLSCERLSAEFKITEIYLDDSLHEDNARVLMTNINLPIHAIFHFFKILFTPRCQEFSTKKASKQCHIRRFAHVLEEELIPDSSYVNVNVIQNNGIVKCSVEQL